MGAVLVGALIVAFAYGVYCYHRRPDDAVDVAGRVVGIVERHSFTAGSNSIVFGPTVQFRHPRTNEMCELEPSHFSNREPALGDSTVLWYSPITDSVKRPASQPILVVAVPLAIGVVIAGIGLFQLFG